jgi:uncharacterized membrane protein YgdD (TMEM256/DUF423 family)
MNNRYSKKLLASASFFALVGVLFGAFGAHFLKLRIPAGDLETIKTGVFYLFIHALAALAVSLISGKESSPARSLKWAGVSFIFGIIFFSGSLFVIGTASLTRFPVTAIGFITPLGGLCFMAGWIFLIVFSLDRPGPT